LSEPEVVPGHLTKNKTRWFYVALLKKLLTSW